VAINAFGEVLRGPGQDVMGRFEPGGMPRAVARGNRAEAQEGVQVMGFAADRLDPGVQHAAVRVAGQAGCRIPLGDAPEHAIEQAPALLDAIARRHFQLVQQWARHTNAMCRPGCWWGRGIVEQAWRFALRGPVHLVRGHALA